MNSSPSAYVHRAQINSVCNTNEKSSRRSGSHDSQTFFMFKQKYGLPIGNGCMKSRFVPHADQAVVEYIEVSRLLLVS